MGDAGEASEARLLAYGVDLHSDTIETLERSSARVDRTDRCGAVVITIGKEISTIPVSCRRNSASPLS
jgi:beta-lactamase superfamily II metal-dependent hydrolase